LRFVKEFVPDQVLRSDSITATARMLALLVYRVVSGNLVYNRHPQYVAFIAVMLGFLLQ